jgi:hypothetical protein
MATPRTVGATAEPARATGLADHDVLVVRVADGADRRQALARDQAHFAGAELELGVAAVLADELGIVAGGAGHLATAALLQLDVMTIVPTGMLASGIALPGLMSTLSPDTTWSPP